MKLENRVQMIGIDHKGAGVAIREKFSFTKKSAQTAMDTICREAGVEGCVILSTCNRMEIYISTKNGRPVDLCSLLCKIKQEDTQSYRQYFTYRTGKDAVRHLFFLTSGFLSQIIGEDQILSQTGDALLLAREGFFTDTVLEVLFRQAVTAAKKVKTDFPIEKENSSAPRLSIKKLSELGYDFKGKNALVIGNGMMGKLTALALKEAGAHVTVTVRQYKSGMVEIPPGCRRIPYGERYSYLPECDLVFSATASPNVTITKEQVNAAGFKKGIIFIDLAVPRDVEPEIGKLEEVSLYDIDDFAIDRFSDAMKQQYEKASCFLEDAVSEFESWYLGRSLLPLVEKIGANGGEEISWRMGKAVSKLSEENQRQMVKEAAEDSGGKVIRHMLFSLRDGLSPEEFKKVLYILEEEYGQ